jgi:hypothetical protein
MIAGKFPLSGPYCLTEPETGTNISTIVTTRIKRKFLTIFASSIATGLNSEYRDNSLEFLGISFLILDPSFRLDT